MLKRLILNLILIGIISIVFTACNNGDNPNVNVIENTLKSSTEASPNIQMSNSPVIKETNINQNDNLNTKTLTPLSEKDFVVSDGINTIGLDINYSDFKVSKQEKKVENNLLTEEFSGGYKYKYYFHEFNDFTIYTSNVNFNKKNRDIMTYYISGILLKTTTFKTARGLSVGSNMDEVINLYGNGEKSEVNGNVVLTYKLDDRKLSFTFDKGKKVQATNLSIIVNNAS